MKQTKKLPVEIEETIDKLSLGDYAFGFVCAVGNFRMRKNRKVIVDKLRRSLTSKLLKWKNGG